MMPTLRNRGFRPVYVLVPAFAAAALTSCGDDGGGDGPVDEGPRAEVLAHLGEDVVVPTLVDFQSRAAELETATAALAGSPDDTGLRADAQAAWVAAMDVWQEAELMQVGPAGAMFETPGGDDFRDQIYPWPDLRLCSIDELTVSDAHDDAEALAAEAPSRRGLGALEYLLYVETTDNNCSPLSEINDAGTWDGLIDEIPGRRAAMAAALSVLVSDLADDLVGRWTAAPEPFLGAFTDPASGVYGSAQTGLNAVSDALFYIETETRNMKLGETAGINVSCDADTCPESRESRFADRSKEHILANVRGFRRMFFGGDESIDGPSPGFDDLLAGMGAGDVAMRMDTAVADAAEAVAAIPGTLGTAVDESPTEVETAYQAVRQIDEILETEVLAVLGLSVPQSIPADND